MASRPRSWLDYRAPAWVQWCPGCGNFGILTAIYKAFAELGLDPARTVLVSGIGCSSRTPYYVNVSGVHTLHGRPIPVASGIKMANPELTVVVTSGDGDLLGIGAGHFVAVGRRNIDITIILHDNAVYGLTKGQAGPTLPSGVKTKALATPNLQDAVNPLILAIASGFTFIARGYAYHTEKLKELIKEAIRHPGTALVDVLQPCPTYNNVMTAKWYEERIYYVEEEGGYDPYINEPGEEAEKLPAILAKAAEWGDRIPLGVIMVNRARKAFHERLESVIPGYLKAPPARRPTDLRGAPVIDVLETFKDRVIEA